MKKLLNNELIKDTRTYMSIFWILASISITGLLLRPLFGSVGGNVIAFLIISISIFFFLTDVAEAILRAVQGARPLYTKKLINHLEPLFNDVKSAVAATTGKANVDDITLYVIDSVEMNAFTLGKKTIILTRGCVNGLSDSALKGILAHEIGHIMHRDTFYTLLVSAGNLVYTLTLKLWLSLINKILDDQKQQGGALMFLYSILTFFTFVYEGFGNLMISFDSRENEYKADQFAYELGYGEELLEALYVFDALSINDRQTIKGSLFASHPLTANRIAVLENS